MSDLMSIRLPSQLKRKLKIRAIVEHRSLNNQIEAYLSLMMIADENPDLPLQFIRDILEAKAEKEMGLAKPFKV